MTWLEWALLCILTAQFVAPKLRRLTSRTSPIVSYPYIGGVASASKTGCLHVRCGPMFCGKTTWLLKKISQYADLSSEPPLLINSIKDNRDDKISSHGSQFRGVSHKVKCVKTKFLGDVDVSRYSVVGIDEAQFYDDLKDTVYKWVAAGKQVYCAGLDGYSDMKPFGQIHLLVSIAETFSKDCAVCLPHLQGATHPMIMALIPKAPFTARITGSTAQVDVGGADKYMAVCRACHNAVQA